MAYRAPDRRHTRHYPDVRPNAPVKLRALGYPCVYHSPLLVLARREPAMIRALVGFNATLGGACPPRGGRLGGAVRGGLRRERDHGVAGPGLLGAQPARVLGQV